MDVYCQLVANSWVHTQLSTHGSGVLGKMFFSYLTMDIRSPMVANYLVAWICAIIPPLCLCNHMCAVHQGMNFCVQQLVQFSHRELFECILLKTQLAPLTSFWLIPLLFSTGGLSLKKLAVDQ